jgi:neutral trehalase
MNQELRNQIRDTFESNPETLKDMIQYLSDLANEESEWTNSSRYRRISNELLAIVLEDFLPRPKGVDCDNTKNDVEYALCN